MNFVKLQKMLIAAARRKQPDDRVPFAFEQRIMAVIAARAGAGDRLAFWARGLWRAAVTCVLVAGLCGVLSLVLHDRSAGKNGNDLSQEFENTLLASVDQGDSTP
jgi:hypothetical protein